MLGKKLNFGARRVKKFSIVHGKMPAHGRFLKKLFPLLTEVSTCSFYMYKCFGALVEGSPAETQNVLLQVHANLNHTRKKAKMINRSHKQQKRSGADPRVWSWGPDPNLLYSGVLTPVFAPHAIRLNLGTLCWKMQSFLKTKMFIQSEHHQLFLFKKVCAPQEIFSCQKRLFLFVEQLLSRQPHFENSLWA